MDNKSRPKRPSSSRAPANLRLDRKLEKNATPRRPAQLHQRRLQLAIKSRGGRSPHLECAHATQYVQMFALLCKPLRLRTKAMRDSQDLVEWTPGLNGLLWVTTSWDAKAVKNHPGSVRLIKRIEVNPGNSISDKIVALFQSVLNANMLNHIGIILTWM